MVIVIGFGISKKMTDINTTVAYEFRKEQFDIIGDMVFHGTSDLNRSIIHALKKDHLIIAIKLLRDSVFGTQVKLDNNYQPVISGMIAYVGQSISQTSLTMRESRDAEFLISFARRLKNGLWR